MLIIIRRAVILSRNQTPGFVHTQITRNIPLGNVEALHVTFDLYSGRTPQQPKRTTLVK